MLKCFSFQFCLESCCVLILIYTTLSPSSTASHDFTQQHNGIQVTFLYISMNVSETYCLQRKSKQLIMFFLAGFILFKCRFSLYLWSFLLRVRAETDRIPSALRILNKYTNVRVLTDLMNVFRVFVYKNICLSDLFYSICLTLFTN